ncbi:Hypothetical_protein [Hexamita inflata]|uniref:Hypothetical_protein n=1 Tax=Hexamita inflata TaxID=28002 RepID=A0AA86NMU6_9EUKA|nr:Hypothetical protein HINF_LOCUS10018 [Hexamita inflata]
MKIEQNSVNQDLIQFSLNIVCLVQSTCSGRQVTFITVLLYNKMHYECLKLQIVNRVGFSVRYAFSTLDESAKVHKRILLCRPLKKLNIWKREILSSQFIKKIISLENNYFTHYFQKQKRPSQTAMMLSYTTTLKHNDIKDNKYCHKLRKNIYKIVQIIFTSQSERETLIPFMFDSEVSVHTIKLSQKNKVQQPSGKLDHRGENPRSPPYI